MNGFFFQTNKHFRGIPLTGLLIQKASLITAEFKGWGLTGSLHCLALGQLEKSTMRISKALREQPGSGLPARAPTTSRARTLKSCISDMQQLWCGYCFHFLSLEKTIAVTHSDPHKENRRAGFTWRAGPHRNARRDETPALGCRHETWRPSSSYQHCINFLPKLSGSWLCLPWHLD